MSDSHERVQAWLRHFSLQSGGAEVLHTTETGRQLLASDLQAILDGPPPKEQREPSMLNPERRVQRNGSSTSFSAAVSNTPEQSKQLYAFIYWVLKNHGRGHDEAIMAGINNAFPNFRYTPSGLRSRRAELVEAGWVEDSGEKRPTVVGRPSIVWRAVDSRE